MKRDQTSDRSRKLGLRDTNHQSSRQPPGYVVIHTRPCWCTCYWISMVPENIPPRFQILHLFQEKFSFIEQDHTQFEEWVHNPRDEKIHQLEAGGVGVVFHSQHLEDFGSKSSSSDSPPSTTNKNTTITPTIRLPKHSKNFLNALTPHFNDGCWKGLEKDCIFFMKKYFLSPKRIRIPVVSNSC